MAREQEAPPRGEELHLPGPSYVPFFNAAAVALALIGLTTTLLFTVAGGIVFLVTTLKWARDVGRDVDELPLEHP
jgi:heme/copper-type cytochrome/quinol oxidase subunit 1